MNAPDLQARIERIRARLATLATTTDVRLNPPLTEEEVRAFEVAHGIELPPAYRIFVTEIGDGGYGPTYGLLRLNEWGAGLGDPSVENLARPFPLTPGTEVPEDWVDHYDEELTWGTLTVVHGGCSDFTVLVVSGPARGRLVEVNGEDFFAPYFHTDQDFLAWYERWLDFVTHGYDLTWFTQCMSGTAPTVAHALLTDPNAAVRDAAACTLIAHPDPGPIALDALAQALTTDPAAVVRQSVIRALGSCGPRGEDLVAPALNDLDPAVRSLAANIYGGVIRRGWTLPPHRRDTLMTRLHTERAPEVRETIERALDGAYR